MFIVLSSRHKHCDTAPGSFDEHRLSASSVSMTLLSETIFKDSKTLKQATNTLLLLTKFLDGPLTMHTLP